MSLAAGRRLGPYQIESVIGSGGMGEVYLARDTRLGRSVAVKILPAHLSEINSRRRFDHEARVVSNLNHPNICAIHDVGHDDDIDYLVMEYLQGETLEARLRRGPLPLEQALRIAIDIAGAMHVAHMAGVVHRDLKPGNIMLTGSGTKLLDFGLAKIVASRAGDTTVTSALTSDSPLTADQTIVGTLAYMAPEQLEGRAVDMRADIFALGAVLYEMISGRRAFAGESRAAIIAAILTGDPPPASTVNPSVPVGLDRVITRCLARSPEERWQNAHDLRLTLEWIREGGDAHAVLTKGGNTRERWIWAALVTALALAVVALWSVSARRHAPEQPALLLSVTPPKEDASIRDAVISPDGRWLAFTAALPRQLHSIWIRRLDATEAQLLPGTEGVGTLFWSPDNRFVAYFIGTRLMKIEIPDGTPQAICDALHGERGTWGTDGTILFGNNGAEGILRVSASGGTPSPATRPTGTAPVGGDMHPYFLPDSHHFLFDRDAGRDSLSGIFVGALDSDETVRILPDQSSVAYAPPGYLLFVRARNLVAQPFDAATLRLGGQPHTIAANIADIDFTRYIFSVSANGMLAFRSVDRNSRLAWIDRTGRLLQKVGEPADYVSVDLSPDDTRAAVERIDPESGDHDVWIVDLARETSSRLTFDSGEEMYPIWSPDGTRVAYALRKNGQVAVLAKSASGAGPTDTLVAFDSSFKWPSSWSRDYLVFECAEPDHFPDMWVKHLDGATKAAPYERTPHWEAEGQISPDGRWLAEMADGELLVQSFPIPDGKWQVAPGGGALPRWRRDGKELFYGTWAGLWSVEVSGGEAFHAGTPHLLFNLPGTKVYKNRYPLAVARDGQKFLANIAETQLTTVTIVTNWTAALK
jgi:Tol biopolymer transport system component